MARLYVPLDVNFPDDDKIEAVGLAGAGLYAQALCVCKRTLSDGRITRTKLRRLGADDDLIERCLSVGLFVPDADDAVRIPAWLGWNAPAESVLTSERAKQLAHVRHHVNGGKTSPNCRYCTDPEAQVDADACGDDADRTPAQCADAMPEVEVETKPSSLTSENRSDSDPAPAPRTDDEIEQESRRALLLLSRIKASAPNVTNPDAFAASVRSAALTDGTADELRNLVRSGMTAEDAAARLADPLAGVLGGYSPGRAEVSTEEAEAIRERARKREQDTLDAAQRLAAEPIGDHAAGLAAARAARCSR